jgi:hypothetical protein
MPQRLRTLRSRSNCRVIWGQHGGPVNRASKFGRPSPTLGFTCLLTAGIFPVVSALATEGRAKSFKVISPGMLPVLGIIFGLSVAFTAAQVWADNDHAGAAVSREAGALRAVTLLAAGLPAEQEARLVKLVRSAQREIITALDSALDARRQRIIVSQAEVNSVKWWCLFLQAPFLRQISVGPGPLLQIMPEENCKAVGP